MKESEKKSESGVARDEVTIGPGAVDSHTSPSGGATAEEQIRMRAYELYRDRGVKVGDDMADWLRAEREYLEHAPRITTDLAAQGVSASAASATPG